MKNWIPKNKTIRSVIAGAVFSAALYFVCLFLLLGELQKIEDKYLGEEFGTSEESKIVALRSILEINKEDIQVLRAALVQSGDEVSFIRTIEEIGQKTSLKFEISSIDVKTKESDSIKEDIVMKVSVEGSWISIMSFIDLVQKTYLVVEVRNLSLDLKTDGIWSGFVELVAFREKQK